MIRRYKNSIEWRIRLQKTKATHKQSNNPQNRWRTEKGRNRGSMYTRNTPDRCGPTRPTLLSVLDFQGTPLPIQAVVCCVSFHRNRKPTSLTLRSNFPHSLSYPLLALCGGDRPYVDRAFAFVLLAMSVYSPHQRRYNTGLDHSELWNRAVAFFPST